MVFFDVIIWELFGNYLGIIWELFGNYLAS